MRLTGFYRAFLLSLEGRHRAGQPGGFTLIQVAVMVGMLSLIVAGAVQAYRLYTTGEKVTVTRQRLAKIMGALEEYRLKNGFLPCPAALTEPVDTGAYARVTDCSAPAPAGIFTTTGTGGAEVRIGAVPGRSLNVPDEDIYDMLGRRMTYVVTTDRALPVPPPPAGAITITNEDLPSNSTTTADYVLVSHGAEGAGAYMHSGALSKACAVPPASKDGENCDLDSEFIYTKKFVMVAGAEWYDDFVANINIRDLEDVLPPPDRQIFNFPNPNTWVKPDDFGPNAMTHIQCWGGGGGGGWGVSWAASGGGGGAYEEAFVLLSTLAVTENVIVGTGGASDADGVSSQFGAILTAAGGRHGCESCQGGLGGVASSSGGVSGAAGGGFYNTFPGGRGGSAGGGGGAGGTPGIIQYQPGFDGLTPGGGGGGGTAGDTTFGGRGAPGRCVVTTYNP